MYVYIYIYIYIYVTLASKSLHKCTDLSRGLGSRA